MTSAHSDARLPAFAARRFTAAVEAAMRARYELRLNTDDTILTAEQLARAAQGAEHVFVTVTERVTREVIASLSPTLKVLATLSVGMEHIDLQAAKEAGVTVVHTPNVLSAACAEIAMMLILNAARRGYEGNVLVRSGRWTGWAPTQLLGLGLVDRRLGIFGMGRIGREVASRAAAFGMQIHYHNRRRLPPEQERGAIYHESGEQLLQHSDVLCVCAPGGAELDGYFNAQRLALLPDQAIFVNVSRGSLVDDDALVDALESGKLFAAGLDVYDNEPALDDRYRKLDSVFLTPHIGSATIQTRDAMGFLLLDSIEALERGSPPPNCIMG